MNKRLMIVLSLVGAFSAQAGTTLWDAAQERGGWRAFGNGMLGAQTQADEVRMAVDWAATTYGVGAVFESGSEIALPSLSGIRKITVEARASEANGTQLAPEWVGAGDRAWRVSPDRQASLTENWQTFTFEVPQDFVKFSGSENATGLRLLFVNPEKPGRADVYFRNVKLEP